LALLTHVVETSEFISTADCLVCGGGHSPTLCLLLRMVTSIPLLFTLQAPLSFRMPKGKDQRALLVAFFREMARPTRASLSGSGRGQSVVSTSLIFLQRQVWVQTGCLLPVVRNHNLYVLAAPGVGKPKGPPVNEAPEVIFWQNHIALKPDCAMSVWRFLKQNILDSFPYNIVFKNVRSLPTHRPGRKVYSLKEHESTMLSYGSIAQRFSAAVLFPHDLGMISFDDLWAASVPLFLPTDELVVSMAYAHMSSTTNYPWYLVRDEHADLSASIADGEAEPPWDPGWGGLDAISSTQRQTFLGRDLLEGDRMAQAVSVSNFALFPHVRRFAALAELLQMLAGLSVQDLAAISAAMRRSTEEAWAVTSEFYKRAAAHLLGIR